MSQQYATQFEVVCLESDCSYSARGEEASEVAERAREHTLETDHEHDLEWTCPGYTVPQVVIGEFVCHCETCGDKTFETAADAKHYRKRHLKHNPEHDISNPEFVEADPGDVTVYDVVDELMQRDEFQGGVPIPVIFSVYQHEIQHPKTVHRYFRRAVTDGYIYESEQDRYAAVMD